jgi:hypothetical protein
VFGHFFGEWLSTQRFLLQASVKGPIERVLALVHRMTELSNPLLFWAGYASSVLVSSMYLQNWTVLISQSPRTRIFPRRWFDLAGKQVQDVWESALKAVVGVVAFRPGVSQVRSLQGMCCVRYLRSGCFDRPNYAGGSGRCTIGRKFTMFSVTCSRKAF